MTQPIRDLGSVPFTETMRTLFFAGTLRNAWRRRYPMLFDSLDAEIAKNQAAIRYHFFEWLAAVTVFNATGYHSLIESYQFRRHAQKHEIARRFLPDHVAAVVLNRPLDAGPQCPDLLCYAPDYSDWLFCDAKGPRDRISDSQRVFFEQLAEAGNRPVYVLRFALLRALPKPTLATITI